MNGILSVSFVCSAVSRSISCARCLPVVTAESGYPAFYEKLVHFLVFVVKVDVVTAEASQSEELREWSHFLGVVDERTNVASSYENQLVCSVH